MRQGYPADTVEEYLAAIPDEQRKALAPIRRIILDTIPDAGEHIGYQIPIFDYKGRGLVGLSVADKHCSLHIMSPALAEELIGVITEGTMSGATLQFPPDKPLSEDTVRLIVARRIAEVDAR